MNIYTRAPNQADDSLEYRLLHILSIDDYPDERKVCIEYSRLPDDFKAEHSYEDFDALPKGTLDAILTEYDKHPPSLDQSLYPLALFAAISGAYVDITELGHAGEPYPLMTNIQYIEQSETPGMFKIYGYFFKISHLDDKDIPVVKIGQERARSIHVEGHHLENKWPGIIKALPVMESFGYTIEDILREIGRGILKPAPPPILLNSNVTFD